MTNTVLPDAPACPSWCAEPSGHGWDTDGREAHKQCRRTFDVALTDGPGQVWIDQLTTLECDGVHVDEARVYLEVVTSVTADEADALAKALRDAAGMLRR